MQNTVRFFDTLPLLLEEMDIVLLYPKKSSLEDPQYKRQFREEFKVRRSAILQWLVYLKEHHPDYRDINISGSRLDALPTDEDVIHRVARFEMDEPESCSEEGPVQGSQTESDALPQSKPWFQT
jgi:ATP-dependent DNA helicase PIF1